MFEGLFPPDHDTIVQSLLYRFAQWHALAKLRMHSGSTITFLEETFEKLSRKLRKFQKYTCAAFNAVELPREKRAREKRASQRAENGNTSQESSGARVKKFNLLTYKFHAMGDYASTIRLFGTTDSFTTQIVRMFMPSCSVPDVKFGQGELAHRALKAFYPLTNKLDTPAQLAKHERRRRVLRRVAEAGGSAPSSSNQSPADTPPSGLSEMHHYISHSQNNPVGIFTFLRENNGDPAVKVEVKLMDLCYNLLTETIRTSFQN